MAHHPKVKHMNTEEKSEEYRKGWREASEKYRLVFVDQLENNKFLRDEFAIAILPAVHLLALQDNWASGGEHWREAVAQECYRMAELMIQARKSTFAQ